MFTDELHPAHSWAGQAHAAFGALILQTLKHLRALGDVKPLNLQPVRH